ncbi:translation initiation factor IF-2-like [Phyllostomus discolor]|uniref:Translation initiation factor IF-2-like n=1 Tax=Phyllostomus discolor TaxID=89673 RepID=A0A7E6D0N9_9CHIR|nr:translation initiation factor IF-2-like [Phyllostomus discolor]
MDGEKLLANLFSLTQGPPRSQRPSARSRAPAGSISPALAGRARASERPAGTSQRLNPGWWGANARHDPGLGGCAGGSRSSYRGCKTRGSRQHRPGPPRSLSGARSPSTPDLPPSLRSANPPRTSQGELPAEAQERRPQRLAGFRRCSLQAGCCLSRGSCSIRPPRPAAGRNRRKVEWVRGGADTIRSPLTRPGSKGGRSAARRPGRRQPALNPPRPGDCSERPRSRGEAPPAPRLAPCGRWPRPPLSSQGRCNAAREAPDPRSRCEAGAEPAPTFWAWRTPAARPRRAPWTGNSARKKAGESSGRLHDRV